MKLSIRWVYENDEGEEIVEHIGAKYEMCGRCEGKGTHMDPNVDGHGITQEEWERDWSYEMKQDYLNGVYDVDCYECKGLRVVLTPWEQGTPPDLWKRYQEHLRDEAEYEAMCAAERRMGC